MEMGRLVRVLVVLVAVLAGVTASIETQGQHYYKVSTQSLPTEASLCFLSVTRLSSSADTECAGQCRATVSCMAFCRTQANTCVLLSAFLSLHTTDLSSSAASTQYQACYSSFASPDDIVPRVVASSSIGHVELPEFDLDNVLNGYYCYTKYDYCLGVTSSQMSLFELDGVYTLKMVSVVPRADANDRFVSPVVRFGNSSNTENNPVFDSYSGDPPKGKELIFYPHSSSVATGKYLSFHSTSSKYHSFCQLKIIPA